MKTYVVEVANGPFQEIEAMRPEPLRGHVLVKINPLDTKIRTGQAGHAKQPLPAVLGLDMAGIVETSARVSLLFSHEMRCSGWWAA